MSLFVNENLRLALHCKIIEHQGRTPLLLLRVFLMRECKKRVWNRCKLSYFMKCTLFIVGCFSVSLWYVYWAYEILIFACGIFVTVKNAHGLYISQKQASSRKILVLPFRIKLPLSMIVLDQFPFWTCLN